MQTIEGQYQTVDNDSAEIQIHVTELVVALWARRRWLGSVSATGLVFSICIVLLIPNKYTSTTRLMPPDRQTISNISMLDPIAMAAREMSMGESLMDTATPAGTVQGVLRSRTSEDDIVNRFNLRSVYRDKNSEDARKSLEDHTTFMTDKDSGIISISVTDKDKYRARAMAAAYVDELDSLLISVNSSSASRERQFLGTRLESLKTELDVTSAQLSKFSSQNATLNPQTQGLAMIEAVAKLQGESITAQSELNALRAQYSDDNVRVRAAQVRVDELNRQLRKMSGVGENRSSSSLSSDQPYPSIRDLPLLGATYTGLYRKLTMQETLYAELEKQYELAKVQEAREVPAVKILDQPVVADKKSSPHRSLIVLIFTIFWALSAAAWVSARKIWEITGDRNPLKIFGESIMRTIQEGSAKPRDEVHVE